MIAKKPDLASLGTMGLRYSNQQNEVCFFVTTTFHEWHRYGEIPGMYEGMATSLRFCGQKYKAQIAGYVFMPSHIHLLLFLRGKDLAGFMRDFKKFVSQKIASDLGFTESNIWMPRYDRVVIRSENVFRTKLRYIHANPVRAGLVGNEKEWPWSSAHVYLTDAPGKIAVWRDWA
ncbi:MAG: transposase [bacterium]